MQNFSRPIEVFGGGLEGSNEEKMGEATEGRVKCREALLEWQGAFEDLVGLSMCDGMIETVKYIWVNI